MDVPSLDGRWFRPADTLPDAVPDVLPDARPAGDQHDPDTVFRYSEQDGEVWGVFAGGQVRRGYLVGSRTGDQVDTRYVRLDESGRTFGGRCRSSLRVLDDGRLRIDERWESEHGSGTSVLVELPEG